MCTGCQASIKTHNYGHYLCTFLNAGFQNLGKLNTGFDVLLLRASLGSGIEIMCTLPREMSFSFKLSLFTILSGVMHDLEAMNSHKMRGVLTCISFANNGIAFYQ